jgi:hypothetical protein
MRIFSGAGALALDFHKNNNLFSKNYGNYTTLEGSYQWQKGVGYNWWYDWFFNLGGSVDKKTFSFVKNGTHYVVWCWKGEYWNLGAGAEIGIYYNNNAAQANAGYYLIDPEFLLIRVLMNVVYDGELITTNFAQTNWWVTSFTPRKQKPELNKLSVALKVEFAGQNSSPLGIDHRNLMPPFYAEGLVQKNNDADWKELTWAPTAFRSGRNLLNSCGKHPAQCTDILNPPCKEYTDKVSSINGFQFYINY